MKIFSLMLALGCGTSAFAAEHPRGILTDRVCLDYINATVYVDSPGLDANDYYGRGLPSELKIRKRGGHWIVCGKILSTNTGSAKQGVPIYTGDLSRTNTLRLMALSDADGSFKFYLRGHVGLQTEEVNRFLYVGEQGVLLRSYEISYSEAQPDAVPEPPPAAADRESSKNMIPKPESEAPADGGGR